MSELNLDLLSDLLTPNNIAPDKDFFENHLLHVTAQCSAQYLHNVRFIFDHNIYFIENDVEEIQRLLKHWRSQLAPEIDESELDDDFDDTDLSDLSNDAPVIRLVNHLFERALDLNASDIHFEPEEGSFDIRCRVDGVMTLLERLPLNAQLPVTSRLKLMAKLDIGEKRLPQDGRIEYQMANRKLDLRVSTLPGVHGESVVLRILDRNDVLVDLSQLGMPTSLAQQFNKLINQPHGIILVTGPTGSGKTTTLYATLEKINSSEKKIITVEDPVEYQMEGITQIHVNSKIGLSFASGLRSILRQDPDTIMIGEIRDHETATIAIESALTGHLVFSTLHTNDAAGAISRLQDMGVDSYLISSSLLAVQAQRLVRKICDNCRESAQITTIEANLLGVSADELSTIYHGKGCSSCGNTGYRGRIGLYELLIINDDIRKLINTGADANSIRKLAQQQGMILLREDALDKLKQGLTTPEEVLRVSKSES